MNRGYLLAVLTLFAFSSVVFAQDVKITRDPFGATISGYVPSSERCYTAKMGEAEVKSGRNKGKTDKIVMTDLKDAQKGLWLGITAMINNKEIDFKVEIVSGRFSKRVELPLGDLAKKVQDGSDIQWVAKLWRAKVPSNVCPYENGKMCEYCRKNGYHMNDPCAEARE